MYRCLFTGGDHLILRSIQLCDAQVIADAVMEQMGFLGHKALQIAEIHCINIFHRSIGDLHHTVSHCPEPHQQLQQCRLTTSASSGDADDRMFRNFY